MMMGGGGGGGGGRGCHMRSMMGAGGGGCPMRAAMAAACASKAAECKKEATDCSSSVACSSSVGEDTVVEPAAPQPLNSRFLRHANIPDTARVEQGQTLVKTWVVTNNGIQQWPENSKLIFVRGDRELLGETEEFSIETAKPDQTLELSVPFTTPVKAGRYTALFQLADADRKVFGARFSLEVQVVRDEEDERKLGAVPLVSAVKPVTTSPTVDTSGWVDVKVDTAPSTRSSSPTTEVPKPLEVVKPVAVPVSPKPVASVPAKPAPPATPAPKPSRFESQLQALSNMGFKNAELNSFLLEKHGGDLQKVTNWLLENMAP